MVSFVPLEILKTHIAYTTWASARIVQIVSELPGESLSKDFGTADRNILGTLGHVLSSDRTWLARLEGDPNPPGRKEEDKTLAALQQTWPAVHGEWKRWLDGLHETSPGQVVTYADLKGNRWSQPMWQIVLHMVNHGTHHRGQVSGFVRVLGKIPPSLDLIAFYRSLL